MGTSFFGVWSADLIEIYTTLRGMDEANTLFPRIEDSKP